MSASKTYPRLICEIDELNIVFSLEAKPYVYEKVKSLNCHDYSDLVSACESYLATVLGHIKNAIFIIPNNSHSSDSLLNSSWPSFSIQDTTRALHKLGINALFINKDRALALALPLIPEAQLIKFDKNNQINPSRPRIAISLDNTLQIATLIYHPKTQEYLGLSSAGAHITLSATTKEEQAICKYVSTKYNNISAESFFCNSGIKLIYEALCHIHNIKFYDEITSETIIENGIKANDILCKHAIDTFCDMLGVFIGNITVMINAFGGIYFSGNIVIKMIDYFIRSGFIEKFHAKGRYRGFLEKIPVFIITTKNSAVLGASYALNQNLINGYIP